MGPVTQTGFELGDLNTELRDFGGASLPAGLKPQHRIVLKTLNFVFLLLAAPWLPHKSVTMTPYISKWKEIS